MSAQETGKIVISAEDLQDAKIDETLEQQRASMAGAIQPAGAEKKPVRRLIFTTWFYLLLAGAVGACAAWAIIEPFIMDGITFTGKVESVDPDNSIPFLETANGYTLQGSIDISGVRVWQLTPGTHIFRRGSSQPVPIDALKAGDVVKVSIDPEDTPVGTLLIIDQMRIEPAGTPAPAAVDIAAIQRQNHISSLLLLPLVAGLVALMLGGVEGFVCRTFARAAWCGGIGLLIGLVGGAISNFLANFVYGLIGAMGIIHGGAGGFLIQMFRRSLGWTLAGMGMGLGQGIALKSRKLAFNGFLGGIVGGLVGGLLFDPIALLTDKLAPMQGGAWSRGIGITIIGAVVGLMMGLTDLLTRDAWLKVITGPLRGKEFSFNRTPIRLGSSPKCEIYLFKDAQIDPTHAVIDKLRDAYEISDESTSGAGVLINGQRVVKRRRLVDGDSIKIGDSEFRYATREVKAV